MVKAFLNLPILTCRYGKTNCCFSGTCQQIADVLSYIRNSFGNKSSLIPLAEVKKIKAATK